MVLILFIYLFKNLKQLGVSEYTDARKCRTTRRSMQIHADAAHTHVRLIRRHATELSCMQMTANTFFLLATRTQPVFASDRR